MCGPQRGYETTAVSQYGRMLAVSAESTCQERVARLGRKGTSMCRSDKTRLGEAASWKEGGLAPFRKVWSLRETKLAGG